MENTDVVTRAEQAYRRLRSEILHGDLMPGERLRASDLQGKFQLGLTPIREALMRLSGENLVELDTHRGSRVSQTSLDELRDLMNTRRGVESLCLRSAIAHGDTAWEAAIVAALHTLSRTPLPATPADRAAAAAWKLRTGPSTSPWSVPAPRSGCCGSGTSWPTTRSGTASSACCTCARCRLPAPPGSGMCTRSTRASSPPSWSETRMKPAAAWTSTCRLPSRPSPNCWPVATPARPDHPDSEDPR